VIFGVAGSDRTPCAARLRIPTQIRFDAAGNLYAGAGGFGITGDAASGATPYGNARIRDFGGYDGPAQAAKLNQPQGMRVDGASKIFFVDRANDCIQLCAATASAALPLPSSPGAPRCPLLRVARQINGHGVARARPRLGRDRAVSRRRCRGTLAAIASGAASGPACSVTVPVGGRTLSYTLPAR
jgi:hypothetical protein